MQWGRDDSKIQTYLHNNYFDDYTVKPNPLILQRKYVSIIAIDNVLSALKLKDGWPVRIYDFRE